MQCMSYCQHSCNLCHTVRTSVVQITLSALLQSPSDCQNWPTACHAVSTAAHHTLPTLAQCIRLCQHWHSKVPFCQHRHRAKASASTVAALIELSTLMQRTHCRHWSTGFHSVNASLQHHTPSTALAQRIAPGQPGMILGFSHIDVVLSSLFLSQRTALGQPLAQLAGCSCGELGQGWSSCPPTLSPATGASAATPTYPRASTCMSQWTFCLRPAGKLPCQWYAHIVLQTA